MTGADTLPDPGPLTLHAGCVALHSDAATIILGASGRGKSALALQMIALGCRLVADDRTIVQRKGAALMAHGPAALTGLIEARGMGILRAPAIPCARVTLAVDLDATEAERLPPHRRILFCGCEIDLVHGPATPHFAAGLLLLMGAGRQA